MSKRRRTTPARMAVLFGAFAAAAAQAAPTDLANSPLANGVSSATLIRPNLAFIVDDSGSMDDQNMPADDGTNKSKSCWGYFAYNTLAYNPAVTYKPPYDPNGTLYSDGLKRFPDAVFTAALRDGYFPDKGYTYNGGSTSNSKVDLKTKSNLPNGTFYYSYPVNSGDNGNTTCMVDNKGLDTRYTTVTSEADIAAPNTTAGSAQALTNYANWYSYYRRRAFMMKAAAAEAFSEISDKYRVGLFFLSSQESGAKTLGPNNDLAVDDFTGTQRTTFFSSLLGNRSGGALKTLYTPLRGALARMGRMYAGKLAGWDPVQYSCQQNFTILSTDGFWNTYSETASYGPYGIDGTSSVGDADAPPVATVPASARIKIGTLGANNPCYYASSITVNTGSATVELLSAPAPATSCAKSEDAIGAAVADGINNNGATTGFAASYKSATNELTITAPASAGNLSVSPVATFVHVSGGTRSFTTTAFGGYTAAVSGADKPYRDMLKKANTLADIAYYYYVNDLRTSALGNCSNTIGTTTYSGLCENNVFGSGKDKSSQQHMTTFTIGLGASGTIKYEANYESAPDDPNVFQYYDIETNNAAWPDPIANSGPERIDDLWHAAVNGRGTYYSAANAETLAAGIKSALSKLAARTGSSSAAATSNLEPVTDDNFIFAAKYWTMAWYGDIEATTIDPQTGEVNPALTWNGQKTLDSQVAGAGANADGRTIKYFSATGTGKLKDFNFTNLTADGKGGYFSNFCAKTPTPDQCGTDPSDLNATQVKLANDGNNLVGFLRGQGTYEDELVGSVRNPDPLYRGREHILGDIVNAVPVYLKKPPFTYDRYDTTYESYIKANETRDATVFVAANDGMLHAFNADTGSERWAFVPSFVMPNMWKLADIAYGNNHQYFVDGSPTIADVCSNSTASGCDAASDWKSIIVGGLNKGGCGYYALDVTDPVNPKGLWEFTHENLGYSYGNPVVTRRKDGKWVVIFASGYNNIPGNGCNSSTANSDGNGHVFVLDALTGQLLEDIPTYTSGNTPAGTTTNPSGLAKLNAWLDNGDLNIASRLYGGDLLGNVWRIDFDDNLSPNGKEAMRLAQLTTAAGVPQPITTKVELNTVKSSGSTYNVVLVGTGKYLGSVDPGDTSQNTLYALKDKLQTTGISNVRGTDMVARTLSTSTTASGEIIRTISGAKMDWATRDGWYFDFNPADESPGERVNNDMQLFFNKLTLSTNIPDSNVCNVGGYAYVYYVDINTGLNLATATNSMVGLRLTGNALVAGIKTVRLANGKTVTIVTDTGGGIRTLSDPGAGGNTKLWRTTWREIAD